MRALLINDLKMLWDNKISLSLFMFLPFIILLILSVVMSSLFMNNTFIKPFGVAVVDYDKSISSKMAISSLQGEDYVSKITKFQVMDEAESMELLKKGLVECVVIIPKDFSVSLYYGQNKPIKAFLSKNNRKNYQLIKSFLGCSANLVEATQGSIYTVYHLMQKSDITNDQAFEIAETSIPDFMLKSLMRNDIFEPEIASNIPQTNPAEYYMLCVSIMFIMFSCIIGVVVITKDYENGIITRIRTTPLGTLKYIFEKIILVLSIGLFEFIITLIPAAMIINAGTTVINIYSIISVIMIIFTATTFCIMLSLMARNTSYAVTSSIIGLFIICLFGGCIFPTALMTDTLKTVSDFSFAKWGIDALAWSLSENDFTKTIKSYGILIIFNLVFIALSSIIFAGRNLKLSFND